MKKLLIVISLIFISTFSNAQSNRERLMDIEDRLEMMQAEKDYEDLQRQIQRNSIQSQQKNEKPTQSNSNKEVYKNTMTSKQLNEVSAFWNLSISEYIRRDELGGNICGKDIHTQAYKICHTSVMLNITTSETSKRLDKLKNTCKFISTFNVANELNWNDKTQEFVKSPAYEAAYKKQNDCGRPIVVFGK
jgi:hypothetical protein